MKVLWHGGVTRTVILTKRWAFKMPCLVYGWKYFLYGFLANMQEVDWSGSDVRLCPVRFALPGGLLVVMPRCVAFSDDEFQMFINKDWARMLDEETQTPLPYHAELPIELKTCSFGWLKGKAVAVDYGGCGRDGRTTKICDKSERPFGVMAETLNRQLSRTTKTILTFALCLLTIAIAGRIGGISW